MAVLAISLLLCPLGSEPEAESMASYRSSGSASISQSSGHIGLRNKSSSAQNRQTRSTGGQGENTGMHGQPWAFGGNSRALSRNGIDGDQLLDKTRSRLRKQAKEQAVATPPNARAARARRAGRTGQGGGSDNGIHVSVDQQEQGWDTRPECKSGQVDESVSIDGHHRVRALAGVKENDVAFGLGPEVIVRDSQQVHEHFGRSDQPDVEPGVGMQLSVDF